MQNRILPVLVLALGCGGSQKPTPIAPTAFSWEQPAEEWWGQGDGACPDGGKLEERTENDVKTRQCIRKGTPHGPRGAWHDNGTLIAEGLLRDGEPTGRWREWQPDGKLAAQAHFDDGVLSGKTIQYLTGGARAEEEYLDGKRHGVSRFFEAGDKVIREVRYKEGKAHGAQTEYYPNGRPRIVTHHVDGLLHGTVTRYAPNGEIIGTLEIADGTGPWKEWHDNGKISTDTTLLKGVQDGAYARFHPNGKKAILGKYDKGREVGEWRAWDEEGRLRALNKYKEGIALLAETYEAGKRTLREEFFGDGGRKFREQYAGKAREGTSMAWRKDGFRAHQGQHKANKKTGDWYVFDKDNKATLEVYKGGKRVRRKKAESVPKPHAPGGLETGVERCDRYLRAYLNCPGIPPNVRQDFIQNFQSWNQQLSNASGEEAAKLEAACGEATETWKKGLATAGCQ